MTLGRIARHFSHVATQASKSNPFREELHLSLAQKAGIGILVGGFAVSRLLTPEQKERFAQKYVDILKRRIEIDEQDVRKTMWDCYRSFTNLMIASPAFYALFPLIHKSGLVWHRHLLLGLLKGGAGTLNTVPLFAGLYAAAPPVLLSIQSELQKQGVSKKEAVTYSQALTFLVLASTVDLMGEFSGYKVPVAQMGARLVLLGSVLVSCRMFFGIMAQHQVSASKETLSAEQKTRNFVQAAIGTTVPQWILNAIAVSVKEGKGMEGVMKYLQTADASGAGSYAASRKQFGLTFLQRLIFCFLWNELSSQKASPPDWLGVKESSLARALAKIGSGEELTDEEKEIVASVLQRSIAGQYLTDEEEKAVSEFILAGVNDELRLENAGIGARVEENVRDS